ncbi:MAG: hypothetical protein HDT32_05010 [Clostridiales bacterium]|nr:hypothetical protein [Clostridiales bacterium]
MKEVEKIALKIGYGASDPQKIEEIQGYIDEAVEFMKTSGVAEKEISTHTAYVVKSLWADYRDSGVEESIIKKDGIVVALISNLRRRKK